MFLPWIEPRPLTTVANIQHIKMYKVITEVRSKQLKLRHIRIKRTNEFSIRAVY